MRLLGQFYYFFTKRFRTQKNTKSTKSAKSTETQPSKSTKGYKQTKIKKCSLKTSNGKKVTYSLICIFVIFVHVKKRNRK